MLAVDVKLVALDLDGTLLDPGERIQPETIEALELFVRRGGLVAINTGRPLPAIMRIMSANGVYPGRPFPHALIAEERELYLRDGSGAFQPVQPWNDDIIAAEHALLPKARVIATHVEAALAAQGVVPKPPNEAMEDERGFVERHFNTRDEAELAREVAVRVLPPDVPLQVVRNNRLIALRHRDVGKGKLLRRLAALLGIPPEQVFAVGDSLNDLEMLDGQLGFKAGTVGNADPHVKAVVQAGGGPIAAQPASLGVAELIHGLLGTKG